MSRPVEVKVGRDYEIDYLQSAVAILTAQKSFVKTLSPEEWQRKARNIDGFIDYIFDGFKARDTGLSFDQISKPLITPPSKNYYGRFGLVRVFEHETDFDLVNSSSGETIIPCGTDVAEINIPKLHFPTDKKVTVSPEVVTMSFGLMANYFVAADAKPAFIMGLTHPRLGRLAAGRWNFQVETRPFPPEVHELIECTIRQAEAKTEYAKHLPSLLAVKNQVLVYQTREDFIKRASLQDKAMYEANKPSEKAPVKPELVTWDERATSISSEEKARVIQVLQYMRKGFTEAGILDNILQVAYFQPNKDGENPCLVVLKRTSLESIGPGEGPSLIEKIHAVERGTWRYFHPLPWRFACMLEDTKTSPVLAELFFGTKRIPKPLAVASGE